MKRKIKNIGDVETLPVDVVINKPIQRNVQVLFSHFSRYFIARENLNINDKHTIIDASCGEGYGSFYLSLKAKQVYGLDVYSENLDRAKKYFDISNIQFLTYNVFKRQKLQPVDKIVCIETLEHVPKNDMNAFISFLTSMLKPGGDMFVTVPLGDNKPSSYNKFHKNEPSIDVILKLFTPFFNKIKIDIDVFVNSYNKKSTYCLVTMEGKI